MNKKILMTFALFCAFVQGTWAQYSYYECSWVNNQVVSTLRTASGNIDDISSDKYARGGGLIGKDNGSGYDYFVATTDVTIPNGLTVSGDCKLILLDGVTVTVEGNGIEVRYDATLTIYGQAGNSGKLIVRPEHSDNAGIGSKEGHSPGKIRIHGGYIEAHGGAYAAGIGGGNGNSGADLDIYGGTVKAYGGKQAAGIGGGCKSGYVGELVVYGSDVYAEGGEWGAGIGGGYKKEITSINGGVTIQSGTVTAKGGDFGAGIGGGYLFDGYPVTINGGTVTATGGEKAAGIGGGRRGSGGTVNINSGTVTATGGPYGAGIGGGADGSGATVGITGGTVTATGGMDAAGIGSGEQAGQFPNGGSLTVSGGTVFAYGTGWGAGIGGGEDANGATVEIKGGTVTAKAGEDAGKKNGCAIGAEDGDGHRGSLTIGDKMMVHAGSNSSSNSLFPYETRVPACYFRPYAKIEACSHEGSVWSIDSNDEGGHHTLHCFYCLDRTKGNHTFENGVCTVCGTGITNYVINLFLPSSTSATFYGGYGAAEQFTVALNKTFALPEAPKANEPDGMAFAGWLVGEPENVNLRDTYVTDNTETLLQPGSTFTVTGNTFLIARYSLVDISLADNADNSTALLENNGEVVHSVTLTGRTLYKDGSWNTLCLPFDHEIDTYSPLYDLDGVDVRELSSTLFDNGELTLNFTQVQPENEYSGIKLTAGTPYLIKWPKDAGYDHHPAEYDLHEDDLKFQNVTIKNNLADATTDYIDFIGTFSPVDIYEEGAEKTYLYLGSDNNLYYPTAETFAVNACRAYFQLEGDLSLKSTTEGEENAVRAFALNFLGETTSIGSIDADSSLVTRHSSFRDWISLDGRRFSSRPTARGIYLHKGKKVVLK